jgi:hypothetical protein
MQATTYALPVFTVFYALAIAPCALRFRSYVNRGGFSLLRTISLVGILFSLSLTCLSSVGAQSDFPSYSTKENVPSTWQGSENFPLQESPASYWEKSSSFIPPGREKLSVETLALSGREE